MKLVKPGNLQKILEVLKENVGSRSFNISDIQNPVVSGYKYCKWCAKIPVYGQKQYCGEDCKFSMYCFCYPQTYPATRVLLERQNFKCATCTYDYTPFVEEAIEHCKKIEPQLEWDTNAEWILRTAFNNVPEERKPETDHIVAISNGGESFGLANVEVKCKDCHKHKTSAEARERNKAQNTYSGSRSTYKKVRDMH
jgi:hypothetical protein